MDRKHTKGEWFANNCTVTIPNRRNNDVIARCFCENTEDQVTQDILEMQANAKLIAAAPEILEALIMVKETMFNCNYEDMTQLYKDKYDKINKAINKATK